MNDTFMKEKPIFPLLTSMALPMVVSMLVNALYNIVDSLFVARISEEAMTALSLVYPDCYRLQHRHCRADLAASRCRQQRKG